MKRMTLNDFQAASARTWNEGGTDPLQNAALGLVGEAGEVADEVKKIRYHGHPMDRDKIIKELGDVLYYVAMAALELECSLDTVAKRNVDKLKSRYPDGFSFERSMNRNE
jgi:NTP pyrophosphatase (non-canonical NTP hydrolase)